MLAWEQVREASQDNILELQPEGDGALAWDRMAPRTADQDTNGHACLVIAGAECYERRQE